MRVPRVPRHRLLLTALLAGLAVAPATALAESPANDERERPAALAAPTGTLDGTLEDATLEGAPEELPGETPRLEACGRMIVGDVWARFTVRNGGRMVLRLAGASRKSLDAVLAVSRITKTGPLFVSCDRTDILGQAGASLTPPKDGATYEVRVAQMADSESSARAFQLTSPLRRPSRGGPAWRSRRQGARGTVDRLADTADAYRAVMHQGVTYRVNLAHPSRRCAALRVFSPFASWQGDPSYGHGLRRLPARHARTQGSEGQWTFRVEARDSERFPTDYRLTVAPVRPGRHGPRRFRSPIVDRLVAGSKVDASTCSTSTASTSPHAATSRSGWPRRIATASTCG